MEIKSDKSLLDKIRESYEENEFFEPIVTSFRKGSDTRYDSYELINELLYIKKGHRLCILYNNEIRTHLLSICHDHAGHFGIEKTLDLLQRELFWPKMRRWVENYVYSCDTCQQTQADNMKTRGLAHPLEVPEAPWTDITMDFMTGLPTTKKGHDCIAVVVDRLTKMGHFIAMQKEADAMEFAVIFIREVIRLHGLPKRIVTDRDSKFTSAVWKEIMKNFGVKHRLSTAFHPQTDGQSENRIKTIRRMMRAYVEKVEWDEYLPILEFEYNNTANFTTKMTPFYTLYGFNPSTPLTRMLGHNSDVPAVEELHKNINRTITIAKDAIREARQSQIKATDSNRKEEEFEVGDKVWLSTRNFKVPNLISRKQQPRYIGPYEILVKYPLNSYKLKLPQGWKMHDVFNVSLLKRHYDSPEEFETRKSQPPKPIYINQEERYIVEAILGHRKKRGKLQFLVKWQGYSSSENTWEPLSSFSKNNTVLKDYRLTQEV